MGRTIQWELFPVIVGTCAGGDVDGKIEEVKVLSVLPMDVGDDEELWERMLFPKKLRDMRKTHDVSTTKWKVLMALLIKSVKVLCACRLGSPSTTMQLTVPKT